MHIHRVDTLRRFLETVAFSLVISALLYLGFPDQPYEHQLVYSIVIGIPIWAIIEFGRLVLMPNPDTGWLRGWGGPLLVTLANLRALIGTDPDRAQEMLDLPAELAALPVPPLLLQPVVENAIKHGLEPKLQGGSITVRARLDGTLMTLDVLDTGVGLDPGRPSGDGFGLAQVRERLVTTYGPQGAIELIAAPAGGTWARAIFPINLEPNPSSHDSHSTYC